MGAMAGKTALVTGAASGLGRATAQAFAEAGASVVLADTDEGGGVETLGLIEAACGNAAFVRTDVSSEGSVKAAVDYAVSTFGGLDFAFNNAGIEGPQVPTTEITELGFRRVLDINLMGVLYGMKHETPAMRERGGGVMVNMSSAGGLRGAPNMLPYVASKHAVAGMTKTAALECAKENIRVLSVHPAAIATPMIERGMAENPHIATAMNEWHPIGRVGQPREIVDVVVFLCSDGASFMTGS